MPLLDASAVLVVAVTVVMCAYVLVRRAFWDPRKSRFSKADLAWRASPLLLPAALAGALAGLLLRADPPGWFDTAALVLRGVAPAWPLEGWYRLHGPARLRRGPARLLGALQAGACALALVAHRD
ncbi:hypothetical protein [Streptomyces sp. NBC_00102]|uniref:hypothetical protein n=1 Tax=Streptomyces sp. NBC_00102 TaxID=2975652 RepID=UPI002257D0A4|nr:hypothetical protein [Streptomyces sp. NBC_00102]MCX5401672.1 hypothetical protein [Streptomyces sp. NBC_00102]